MITRDNLELYAKKLMFEMNDDEYKTLENEGVIISIPSKGNFVSDDADQLQSLRVAELTENFRDLLQEMRDNHIKESAILKLVEGVYHDFER